jgi:hypothetical protein
LDAFADTFYPPAVEGKTRHRDRPQFLETIMIYVKRLSGTTFILHFEDARLLDGLDEYAEAVIEYFLTEALAEKTPETRPSSGFGGGDYFDGELPF